MEPIRRPTDPVPDDAPSARSSIDDLLRELDHKINNPLMVISGLAEMILRTEKALTPETVARLRDILSNCDRIAAALRRPRPGRGGGLEDSPGNRR